MKRSALKTMDQVRDERDPYTGDMIKTRRRCSMTGGGGAEKYLEGHRKNFPQIGSENFPTKGLHPKLRPMNMGRFLPFRHNYCSGVKGGARS